MDWASCRLYLGVTFQAIASPCTFGAIAHSAALSCSRDRNVRVPLGRESGVGNWVTGASPETFGSEAPPSIRRLSGSGFQSPFQTFPTADSPLPTPFFNHAITMSVSFGGEVLPAAALRYRTSPQRAQHGVFTKSLCVDRKYRYRFTLLY